MEKDKIRDMVLTVGEYVQKDLLRVGGDSKGCPQIHTELYAPNQIVQSGRDLKVDTLQSAGMDLTITYVFESITLTKKEFEYLYPILLKGMERTKESDLKRSTEDLKERLQYSLVDYYEQEKEAYERSKKLTEERKELEDKKEVIPSNLELLAFALFARKRLFSSADWKDLSEEDKATWVDNAKKVHNWIGLDRVEDSVIKVMELELLGLGFSL